MKQLDNYLVVKQIGHGQFGKVFLGSDINTGEVVAIKQIEKAKLKGKYFTLFESQINVLKTCSNPFVISLKDILKSAHNIYVVTQYCQGGDLNGLLKARGSLSEVEAFRIMVQLLQGFRALREHRVLHRDLKLANILLKEGHVKIADFGFSKISQEAITVLGSPLNMAPEVLREQPYDSKADVYSLGVCIYQLIFGNYPHSAGSRLGLIAKIEKEPVCYDSKAVHPDTVQLLGRMLTPSAKDRISFEELFQLQQGLAELVGAC